MPVQTKHIIIIHHPPGPRKTMSSPAATTTTTTTTTPTTMPTDGGIVDIVGVGTIDEQVANLTTALQREKVAWSTDLSPSPSQQGTDRPFPPSTKD